MTTISADTVATIAGHVLNVDMLAYTPTHPNAPILALPDGPAWASTDQTLEYVTYDQQWNQITIRTDVSEYDRDTNDTDTVSRALAGACRRIETTLATLQAN